MTSTTVRTTGRTLPYSAPETNVTRAQIVAQVRARLDALREAISRELCAIPPPVPACDVHFNRLLEDRSRIIDELRQIVALDAGGCSNADLIAYCRESAWLDAEFKAEVERALNSESKAAAGR